MQSNIQTVITIETMELSGYHLILQLKNNDKEAYKFLFRTYYPELYYLALKYTHIADDAKDLTQSTFIRLWENRAILNEDKPIGPFLFTIHKNNCIDYLRRRINTIPNSEIELTSLTEIDTPFNQVVTKELELKIIQSISQLPPKCRQIFECSRFKGLKYSEIAEKLNISVKTVENQMSIALEKLRAALIDYVPFLLISIFL